MINIQIKATKYLTGVTIQGDFDDFNDLESVICRMTGTSEEFGIHDCNQNIYYSVNIFYSKIIFLALSVPDMFIYSKGYYGKRDQYDQEYKMINSYSNYFKDKALLLLLSASIYQSLEEVIGSDEFNKLYNLINKENPNYMDYITQYIDRCNLELINTQLAQRKDKLIDITRNFIIKNKEYKNKEKRIIAYAHK